MSTHARASTIEPAPFAIVRGDQGGRVARIFISHSSEDNAEALALHQWLSSEGWGAEDDLFLDIHPSGGIAAGERWIAALHDAASRCEAVLFVMSEAWLASRWCLDEYHLAASYHKKLFALLVEDLPLSRLPGGLASQWQVVRMYGRPAKRFVVVHPTDERDDIVYFSQSELVRLHQGLVKAGVGPETFNLQPDPDGPFGWRSPYRGLEALDTADAAVFFGREADTVRALDELRGLAERPDGHLLVILGASGAGKSSFLRAGLVPRLLRDDASWLCSAPLRAGSDGAIHGPEGLVAALREVRRRFGLPVDPDALRQAVQTRDAFLAELATLRATAADRALLDPEAPRPRIVWPLDQAEELFAADAGPDAGLFLVRLRDSVLSGDAVVLGTIRSDNYARMQHTPALAGLRQDTFSLLPVPSGEVARLIRAPAQVLRAKVGPDAPAFSPEVVASLQAEMAGEEDALPLLALAMQRLVQRHAGSAEIGPDALAETGGVARAIEEAAETALREVGEADASLVRRTFVPRLARVDRETKALQRRIARYDELVEPDARSLVDAFVARRLVVRKGHGDASSIEVAHEALLRRWPRLVSLLEADRDGLLLLDGVLEAAEDWGSAPLERRSDFLAHRGSRLDDAVALSERGPEWQRELNPARDYLQAGRAADDAQREQLRRDFARRRRLQGALISVLSIVLVGVLGLGAWLVDRTRVVNRVYSDVLASAAESQVRDRAFDSALRLAIAAADSPSWLSPITDRAGSVLAQAAYHDRLRVTGSTEVNLRSALVLQDGRHIVTYGSSPVVQQWDVTTGELVHELRHPSEVVSARLYDDDTRLVSWATDNVVRTWDLTEGRELAAMPHEDPEGLRVRFYTEARRLLVWGQSGPLVRLFDVDRGEVVGTFEHRRDVSRARLTKDGRSVVTTDEAPPGAAEQATLHRWDVATGKRTLRVDLAIPFVRRKTFVDDAIVLQGAGVLEVRDEDSGALRFSLPIPSRQETTLLTDPARAVVLGTGREHQVIDLVTGEAVTTFETTGRARWCETMPSGRLVVAVDRSDPAPRPSRSRLEVFDLQTGDRLHSWAHEAPVAGVKVLGDGTRVITWTRGTMAQLWQVGSDSPRAVFEADRRLSRPLVSEDDRTIAFGSDDQLLVFDDRGRQLARLDHDRDVLGAFPIAGGTRLLTLTSPGAQSTWRVWDIADVVGVVSRVLRTDGVRSSIDEVAPLGNRYLLASGGPGRLGLLDLSTDEWVADAGPLAGATLIDVLDGPTRALFRDPSGLGIWPPDGAAVTRFAGADPDSSLQLVRGGTRLLAVERASRGSVDLRSWDTRTGEADPSSTHAVDGDGDVLVEVSPEGATALVAGRGGSAVVVTLESGTERARLEHPGLQGMAVGSGHAATWATGPEPGEVRVWDLATGAQVSRLALGGEIDGARFTEDRARLVVWSGRRVHLWDLDVSAEVGTVTHPSEVRDVTLFAEGTLALSWSGPASWASDDTDQGSAAVWRVQDGAVVATFPHGGGVLGAERFAGDTRLLTRSVDHTARIWDLATGEEHLRVSHEAAVTGSVLFAEAARLLTWGRDDTARVWDVASGEAILEVYHPSIAGAALVDDDRRLATWGGDGELRLFPLDGVAPVPADTIPQFVARLCRTRLIGEIDGVPRSRVQVGDRRYAEIMSRRGIADVCGDPTRSEPGQ